MPIPQPVIETTDDRQHPEQTEMAVFAIGAVGHRRGPAGAGLQLCLSVHGGPEHQFDGLSCVDGGAGADRLSDHPPRLCLREPLCLQRQRDLGPHLAGRQEKLCHVRVRVRAVAA
ncbi:hypothetical protein G6F68_020059 [Rhizopus microsporus]|nr:hypothetical protein G6F68_020059 [Rhizopus microsporus]